MAAKSNAERQREHRQRLRELGYVHFTEWVTPEEYAVLRDCLRKLRQGEPLQSNVQESARVRDTRSLEERIRQACYRLAGGKWNTRIRLADLRAALEDVPREELDQELLKMERANHLVLYPLDNPQERTQADQQANLPNSAGFPRHLVYME